MTWKSTLTEVAGQAGPEIPEYAYLLCIAVRLENLSRLKELCRFLFINLNFQAVKMFAGSSSFISWTSYCRLISAMAITRPMFPCSQKNLQRSARKKY